MHFTKTEVKEKPLKNCFEITFGYEHGDADADTSSTEFFYNKTEEQMLNYCKKFNEVAKAIDHANSYGEEMPKEFRSSEILVGDGMYINLEYDLYGKLSGASARANMWINKIYYYDSEGKKFEYDFVE